MPADDKLSESKRTEFVRLWKKVELTERDGPALRKMLRDSDLSSIDGVELTNHIKDRGNDKLKAEFKLITNSTDPKILEPRIKELYDWSKNLDIAYISYALNGKNADLKPETLNAMANISPETIAQIKQAYTDNNGPRLHLIEEFLDYNEAVTPVTLQMIEGREKELGISTAPKKTVSAR